MRFIYLLVGLEKEGLERLGLELQKIERVEHNYRKEIKEMK